MKDLEILFEDEDYVIINKPAGLLTLPDRFNPSLPNLYSILKSKYEKIWTIHRLDADTSGVIVFAKNQKAHRNLSIKFEKREVKKIYLAIVNGALESQNGSINLPLAERKDQKGTMKVYRYKGKKAITNYKVLEKFRNFSLVEIELMTGRMHQIRVHFQAIGHPLVVDPIYGGREAFFLSEIKSRYIHKEEQEERPLIDRLTLHAKSIEFEHYRTGEILIVEAPLPKDFRALLNQLRKINK